MILEQITEKKIPSPADDNMQKLTLIGGGLHVLNPRFEETVRKQDISDLVNRARRETAAGAGALAINLGPGRVMAELTNWVVETIAGAVDIPLFLSSGIAALSSVLEKYGSRITINAVTANSDTLAEHLQTSRQYGTQLVVLLVKRGLVPAGIYDRLQIASEVISMAMDIGLPLNHLYLDPVITCRPDPVAWEISRGLPDIDSILETIAFIKELKQNIKTIVALDNATLGLPREKRSAQQGRMLQLLAEAGLDAAILNCLDSSLMQTAKRIKKNNVPARSDSSCHFLQ